MSSRLDNEETAAHENSAAKHRRTIATDRETDQLRADDHIVVRLHVPERECALNDIDAVAVGSLSPRAFAATLLKSNA
jgi:hypothetical protein